MPASKFYSAMDRHPNDVGKQLFIPLFGDNVGMHANYGLPEAYQLAYWVCHEEVLYIRFRDGDLHPAGLPVSSLLSALEHQRFVVVNP